jgi:dephospho-CoA kinase
VLKVGSTGGIGAGKSEVASRLAALGAVVIDADVLAREAVARDTPGLAEVVAAFGPAVLTPAGDLDRPALGRAVFGDAAARRRLESIIHPRVRARTAELTAAAPPDAIVVNDVPLLVESGLAPTYHFVLVVAAPAALRAERLARRSGLTGDEVRARMRAQASDEQRAAVADAVLENDGTLDDLLRRVDALWAERLVPYERNLRERRPARPAAATVPYDPTWPAQYERIAARVAHAAGAAVRSLDHVGPTAVPGLPAPDVVDIQLGVADMAAADAIGDALTGAGLPRVPGNWVDPAPDGRSRADTWVKRLHAAADPGRAVNLHVRVAGSPPWRHALMMRDYLRSGREALARYAEATEPWREETLAPMREWAERTGWAAGPGGG